MNVWFAIPSARPAGQAVDRLVTWKGMGYRLAVLRQEGSGPIPLSDFDMLIPTRDYLGWAASVNLLAKLIVRVDPDAQWIVTGGDDYLPDKNRTAEAIGELCTAHFAGTYGVMQPTGDRWGDTAGSRRMYGHHRGAYIDRVAGSPWLGRDWCIESYQGNGPMYENYRHMYADEELQEVATAQGVFWANREIIQIHEHWGRKEGATEADIPEFLRPVNSREHWQESTAMFAARKRAGFPGARRDPRKRQSNRGGHAD